MSEANITLTIDGKKITAPEGTTVLDAALDNGIYIPHLCAHGSLRHTANCRLCMVKIAGQDGVAAACSTAIAEGMNVNTKDELADKVRKLSVDFMFKTHPPECVGCPKYGKCQLQSISQAVGDTGRALRRNPISVAANETNPLVMHEMYRCILCGRCVRACSELRGVGALKFEKTDGRMRVVIDGESLDKADCRFCGACIEVCPTGAIREQEEIAKKMEGFTREDALVPCRRECPAHIDIPKYLRFIREERYPEAVATVREKAPFPHSLGYICTHSCEGECRRMYVTEPIAIRDLKRFACERDDGSWKNESYRKQPSGKRAAVVGSGPAGLTAAYYLAKSGHEVTVFEELEKPGGMMRYGIPSYRLPRDILQGEIDEILSEGITLRLGERVDKPAELLEQGFDAVIMATGAHAGVKLPLDGNDLDGVLVNTEFLRAVELENAPDVGKRVIVLGGGNVALDCAGAARRLGATEVHVVCLEADSKMTCTDEELEWALEEGLHVHNSKTFLEITGENGRVSGLRFAGIKSFSFDEQGRAQLEIEPDSEELIAADTVIFATGQRPALTPECGLELGRGNRITVDGAETGIKGVFAAGDAVTGTVSVIRAVAEARKAASAVDIYLGGDGNIEEQLAPAVIPSANIGTISEFGSKHRVEPDIVPPEERVCGFIAMDNGYDLESGQCEASRCLQCDLRLQIAPQRFWSDYETVREDAQ